MAEILEFVLVMQTFTNEIANLS